MNDLMTLSQKADALEEKMARELDYIVVKSRIYQMADVPRFYVPGYLVIRVPLITLAGAALGIISLLRQDSERNAQQRRALALLSLTILIPLASQVVLRGPAFTGMRHFYH